jgi:drug/metabolite transporter (DMT)-like permease
LHQGSLTRAWLAFASVSLFWGTTYLAIRMALEAFPPMTLLALRFLLSGGIMLLAGRLRGWAFPTGRPLWRASWQGLLVLGLGNSCLVVAETWIPSGMAALIITLSPFWLVGMDAAMTGGERLHAPTLAGMGVGLAGVLLLLGPDAWRGGASSSLWKGFLILQLGSVGWNLGSLLQRRAAGAMPAMVSGSIHQFAVGLAFLPLAILSGPPAEWKPRSVLALLWLVVFGSIVGYTSYIYALERLPVAVVGLYNYINPIVAVILGWWFYREPFGPREAFAMLVIFAGVTIVKSVRRPPARA